MKSKDLVKNREKLRTEMQAAIDANDSEKVAIAFNDMCDSIQEQVLAECEGLIEQNDDNILVQRGERVLTSGEKKYYNKIIEAMKSNNPKQALQELDVVTPKTVVDSVFEDLKENHPLLEAINFQNTGAAVEMLVNTDTGQLAKWGVLSSKITEELASGFKKVNMNLNKLSAFLPVCNAMLDLGPAWLDRYVRELLAEAILNGLEEGIVNGTGKDMPVGMNRQVGEGVTVTNGVYPLKEAITVTDLSPVTYGILLGKISTSPTEKTRTFNEVVLVVNPADYFTKIMPATTIMTQDGKYVNDVLPYPTKVAKSTRVPVGRAILGIPNKYFMGVGIGKSGKLEHSDEYKFLDDERVYKIKLYGHGEPLDNNAFMYLNIEQLEPLIQKVIVDGTVATKEQ